MNITLLKQFFDVFWSVCMLKKGPQDIPSSVLLLVITFLVSALVDILNLSITVPATAFPVLLAMALVYSSVLMASLAIIMWLLKYRQRIVQTLSAIFGTGTIISLVALPLLLMLMQKPDEPSIFSIFVIAIQFWSLAVTAHILRFALSVPMLLAGLLAFGYFLLGYEVVSWFIPVKS